MLNHLHGSLKIFSSLQLAILQMMQAIMQQVALRVMLGGLVLLPLQTHAEACLIRSYSEQLDVTLCQQNRGIPAKLFRESFCQLEQPGQQVDVRFMDECPENSFGVCRNAHVGGMLYQQDIHYYGVASDARVLEPACVQQYKGTWVSP